MSWTLTHRFLNAAGRPASGWVYFDLSTSPTLTDTGTFVGTADRVKLDRQGSFTITGLPSETGLFLLVYPRITTGDPDALGPVTIPAQPDGTTINLADLITEWPSTPAFVPWELWGPVLDRLDTIEAGGGGGGGSDPTAVKLTGDQTITGVKTFTSAPVVPDSAFTIGKTSGLQAALDSKAPTTRTITAGTGLTGGGDLTANRTLAVSYGTTAGTAAQGNDTRLSDARTPTSHAASHAAGGADALAISGAQVTSGTIPPARLGTGTASDSTVLYGDGTWKTGPTGDGSDPNAVKLTGDQTVAGVKTFTAAPVVPDGSWTVAKTSGLQTALDGKVPAARTITAGTGLTGGGTLASDRTLAVSYGSVAGTAAQGDDPRLSDARTPTAHAAAHAAGGADPLVLSAEQVTTGLLGLARAPAGTVAHTATTARPTARTDIMVIFTGPTDPGVAALEGDLWVGAP